MSKPNRNITNAEVHQYLKGLSDLSICSRIIKAGPNLEQVAKTPPSFSAETLMAIVINTNRLNSAEQNYQEARKAIIRAVSGGKDNIQAPKHPGPEATNKQNADYAEEMAAFEAKVADANAKIEELERVSVDVEIHPIPSLGLKLDDNPLDLKALAMIEPLIEWQAAPAKDEKKKAA